MIAQYRATKGLCNRHCSANIINVSLSKDNSDNDTQLKVYLLNVCSVCNKAIDISEKPGEGGHSRTHTCIYII